MNARENFRPFTDPEEFERIIEKDTVTEMWRDCLRDYADREAIVFRDTACTYEESAFSAPIPMTSSRRSSP